MGLGDDSLHDFLLDQDVRSVTLCDSSQHPFSHKVPCKQMPNFGDSKIGLTRPLLPVLDTDMECDEARKNHADSSSPSALVTAPSGPQDATNSVEVLSTSVGSPVANPVKHLLDAGEEQGILLDEHSIAFDDKVDPPRLALPQALVTCQYWVSRDTNLKIGEACGESGNRNCRQCRRKFSSTPWLRVHAPLLYVNVCCSCGEYSYQHDYVLRHQRILCC